MTDWNPDDPDATRVYYDLGAWSFDQQAELAAAMADAEIQHGWVGSELVVPEDAERQTDDLIAELEERLGIDSRAADQGSEDLGSDEQGSHEQGSDGGRRAVDLDENEPTTEYDLGDWDESERLVVEHALADAEVPFRWSGAVLLVGTADEAVVDALLDDIESGEYVDLRPAAPTDSESVSADLLTTFFLAGERLRRDPLDADGLEQLLAATDVADAESPPFGVQPRLWTQACALADRVADALTEDEGPDLDEAMAAATELHDLLRPHV